MQKYADGGWNKIVNLRFDFLDLLCPEVIHIQRFSKEFTIVMRVAHVVLCAYPHMVFN